MKIELFFSHTNSCCVHETSLEVTKNTKFKTVIMSSEPAATDTSRLPSFSMAMEDFDAYTIPQFGSVLQAEVVFSSNTNTGRNNREKEALEIDDEEEDRRRAETESSLDKSDQDSSTSPLFLTLYAVFLLSIIFLAIALSQYVKVKRSTALPPIPQDVTTIGITNDTVAEAEVDPDPERDLDIYRRNIEFILSTELHEECSTNFLEGPRKMAIDWLVYEDLVLSSTEISVMAEARHGGSKEVVPAFPLIQRYILMVLFFGTSGELWSGEPWNDMVTVPECNFVGIECDLEGQILILDLGFRKLRGRLPEEVGMLTTLESFSVFSNKLEGTFPTFIYNRLTNLGMFSTM